MGHQHILYSICYVLPTFVFRCSGIPQKGRALQGPLLSTWLLLKVKNIYEACLFPVTLVFFKLSFLKSVLWIRIDFSADTDMDPDPAFFVNADPDTDSDPDPDPDPGF